MDTSERPLQLLRIYEIKHQHYQQQAPEPQGSWPPLTDPPLQLFLLPEVTHIGCLPGPEAPWLARSLVRKQKPSGQSCCVDLGVGLHGAVKVRMRLFLNLFRAHTTIYYKKNTKIENS